MARDLTVDIRADGIEIDGRLLAYPIRLADLDALFDEEVEELEGSRSARVSASWAWRSHGVTALHDDGVHARAVWFRVDRGAHEIRIEGRPYSEEFPPQGPTYPSRDLGKGHVGVIRTSDPGPDQRVKRVIVEQPVPRRRATKGPKVPQAANAPAPVADAVEFHDLNFKLLVLQDLMYDKGLLTPRFDLEESIADIADRDVALDEEGYAPIPEALAYFAAYPVPTALLGEVEELTQDGGNDIYHHIAPLWSGEDDVFDVQDFRDVDLLPNLRALTLTGVDDETLRMLRDKGIDAELL